MDSITIQRISGENVLLINEFFYEAQGRFKLPKNFHSKVVEYENKIYLHSDFDEITVQELASLYKVYLIRNLMFLDWRRIFFRRFGT
jgi:hypothetical protein